MSDAHRDVRSYSRNRPFKWTRPTSANLSADLVHAPAIEFS